jgi:hypothetical protein
VRAANQQSIAEALTQRIKALTAGLADLSEYVRLVTRDDQEIRHARIENVTSPKPIEFVTENGFAIVRPWETDDSQAPTAGRFQFLVRDPHNVECAVTVDIASALFAETAFDTRGRVGFLSSFWICCAERHLADYVTEHECFPDSELTVDRLDPEEVMLAKRWCQKPARQQGQPSVTGPP